MVEENNIDDEHTPLNNTFPSLGLDDWLVQALSAMSITRPTPIQASCICPVLEGTPSTAKLTFRTRLYRWSKDRIGENNSLCRTDPPEVVTRSVWNIRPRPNSNAVPRTREHSLKAGNSQCKLQTNSSL
jgi:hypothetical protein